ncbi:MAG: cbb3-type cytochrome oxidase assembly protein CcoS [Sphingomonas sp.]|nr:cbb3-type cytochrome oxidase assembly protein CcoS [Sphingomonas sp.]
MTGLAFLLPVALGLGLAGLAAFFWAARSGQFEDLDGAALRILIDDEDPREAIDPAKNKALHHAD